MRYTGSCHCGAVRFEVDMEPPAKAFACNCSICSRAGWLLAFVPEASFRTVAGADHLTDYQFNKQHIHHTFCKTCGIHAYSSGAGKDGKLTYSVNMRCLAGLDPTKLPVETFDGASR